MKNSKNEMFTESVNVKTTEENILPFFNMLNSNFALSHSEVMNDTLPIDMRFNAGHIVSISVYSVLFVLSSIGNLSVLIAIFRGRYLQRHFSRVNLLLVHLAVADLMVTFFMMPLEIGWAATVQWKAGDVMCRAMAFFRIFGLYLSGFVLICLAADRYIAVRYPLKGFSSTKRAKVMLGFAWPLSAVCSIPQVFIFHVEQHPVYTWYSQCVTFNFFPTHDYELLHNIFVMSMMYALPIVLLVVLYVSIAVELWKMVHSADGAFGSVDELRRCGVSNIERAKVKSTKMAFIITTAFLVCWTPYYTMCIWYWLDPESAKNVDQRIQKGLFLFACTNSTVNPIVYGTFHLKSLVGANTIGRPRTPSVSYQNSSTQQRGISTEVANGYESCLSGELNFELSRFVNNDTTIMTKSQTFKELKGKHILPFEQTTAVVTSNV